jgi:hypothetical protein
MMIFQISFIKPPTTLPNVGDGILRVGRLFNLKNSEPKLPFLPHHKKDERKKSALCAHVQINFQATTPDRCNVATAREL